MGFQTAVNIQPGVAVAGDFAGTNPRATVQAGPGLLVSPSGGLLVGAFAFVNPSTGAVQSTPSAGYIIGFVHRENQGIIVNFLADSTSLVQSGFPITLFNQGDFWVRLNGGGTRGQTIYADGTNGTAIAAASAPVAASITATIGTTADIAASATAGVMTVSGAASVGVISVGDVLTGTGVPTGTTVVSLGTGTGGTGTYNVAVPGSSTAVAFGAATNVQSSVSSVMDVTAVGSGSLTPGQVLNGTGITGTGLAIASQLTGTAGSTGTYGLSVPFAHVASETVTVAAGTQTQWKCAGAGSNGYPGPGTNPGVVAPGALSIISSWGG